VDPEVTENLRKLRHHVKVLSARLAYQAYEDGSELLNLKPLLSTELPRLRVAEEERKHMQLEMLKARMDMDRMECQYDRIMSGLSEQEVTQQISHENLRQSLGVVQEEVEEMERNVKESCTQCSEMNKEHAETRIFVQHLNDQIHRLEDERDKLASDLRAESLVQHQVLLAGASA